LEKILDETFGKKKPKQVELSVERLNPPMAPPKVEKSVVDTSLKPVSPRDEGLTDSIILVQPIVSEKSDSYETSEMKGTKKANLGIKVNENTDSKLVGKSIVSENSEVDRNTRVGTDDVNGRLTAEPTRAVEKPRLTDSKLAIDFKAIADASEFRRFIYWIRTGQVFRGSNEKLDEALWNTQNDIETVRELRKTNPHARDMGAVVNEFKSKVGCCRDIG